jgi:hypothetical protein
MNNEHILQELAIAAQEVLDLRDKILARDALIRELQARIVDLELALESSLYPQYALDVSGADQ